MSRIPTASATVDFDRPCAGCGYNVRGLSLDGRCPECGIAVRSSRRSLDDPLSGMPVDVVRVFRRGGWVAMACLLVVIVLVVLPQFVAVKPAVSVVVLVVTSVLWLGAVVAITPAVDLPQAHFRGFSERSRLRRIVRWMQLAWVVFAVGHLLLQTMPKVPAAGQTLCATMILAAQIVGVAGAVCLSVLLRWLSDWVRDDDASRYFDWYSWALPAVFLVYLLDLGWPWRVIMYVLGIPAALFLPLGVLSLSRSMHYAVLHAEDAADLEERRRERAERDAARAAQRVARSDGARGAE